MVMSKQFFLPTPTFNASPAPEKYLYTLFRRRRSAYIHLSGAERPEKPEKYLYTPVKGDVYNILPPDIRLVPTPVSHRPFTAIERLNVAAEVMSCERQSNTHEETRAIITSMVISSDVRNAHVVLNTK